MTMTVDMIMTIYMIRPYIYM